MMRTLVGREAELARIRTFVTGHEAGVLMLVGAPGAGLTRLLEEAATTAAAAGRPVRRMSPGPAGPPDTPLLARSPAGRPALVVIDDAHQCATDDIMAVRQELLDGDIGVVLARSEATDGHSDPTDCLRWGRGVTTVPVRPLTMTDVARLLSERNCGPVTAELVAAVHAATDGFPRAIAGIAGLLGEPTSVRSALSPDTSLTERLLATLETAWSRLALARVEQLCRMAAHLGHAAVVAPRLAAALLLSGHVDEASAMLATIDLGEHPLPVRSDVTLLQAMAAVLRDEDHRHAAEVLTGLSASDSALAARRAAHAAWLLSLGGYVEEARSHLAVTPGGATQDPQIAAMMSATRAQLALLDGRVEAVGHLRRAQAIVEGGRTGLPWFRAHLRARLVDALLAADRVHEATDTVRGFHGGGSNADWSIAVVLGGLFGGRVYRPT